MNKTEILAAAKTEGISLNESKLNRYIRLGLLPSHLQGKGYKGGVQADYPNAMTNLRMIEQTRHDARLGGYENLLPYLFWHGCQVRTTDLQMYMMEYQTKIQRAFHKLQQTTEDQIDLDWFLDELIQDPNVRPNRSPGRPSTSEQLKRSAEDQELRQFMQQLLIWIKQWINHGPTSAQEVVATLSLGQLKDIDPSNPLLHWLQAFIDGFRWLKPAEAIDWLQVATVIAAMRSYGQDLEKLLSIWMPPTLLCVPSSIQTHPQVVQLKLLFVLVSHQVPLLHELLTSASFQTLFTEMMSQLQGEMNDASDSIAH